MGVFVHVCVRVGLKYFFGEFADPEVVKYRREFHTMFSHTTLAREFSSLNSKY